MQPFQSLKRLLSFYTLTLFIMLVLYYAMIFLVLKSNSQQYSQMVFDTLQREVSEDIVLTDDELVKIIKKPFFQGISYQLILMLPSGQTYVHRYTRPHDRQFTTINFPNINSAANSTLQGTSITSSYETTNRHLVALIKLESGHQLYVMLRHKPLKIDWTSYQFWLPLITAIALFIIALLYMLKRHTNWEQLLDYTENLTTLAEDSYDPPPFIKKTATPEFLRLGHSLSRISYQLHKNHRRIKTLKHRLEHLVDQAPLPMLMVMRQGQISFFNQRFEQVFATSFQHDTKYMLTDFITGVDKETQQILQDISAQRVKRTLLVCGLENKQTYQLQITPWFGEHGQVHGFTALLSNVNKIVQRADNLQLQNERLQTEINGFNRVRSIIGHELRTPLNAIIGTLDLIEPYNMSAKQQEIFNTLRQSSQSMLTMLNDMLEVAKIEAGKAHIVDEATDIFELGEQTTSLMVGSARRQGISLMYFFAPDCPRYINTDSSRMRQILLNLLDNAIKFTSSGYVALVVEPINHEQIERIKENALINTKANSLNTQNYNASERNNISKEFSQHQWIRFSVKDTGIGITETEQHKLFSYFKQANDQISQNFGGTGLGLAISNSFAHLLGGFIQLDSDGHSGSTFSLYLPCNAPTYQPIYHFHNCFTHIRLIAVVKEQICATFIKRICSHLSLPADVYTCFDSLAAQRLHEQLKQDTQRIKPVLLLDYEYYEMSTKVSMLTSTPANNVMIDNKIATKEAENIININSLLNVPSLPKILLSIRPERSMPSTLLEQFDGFLNKPVDIPLLLSELIRLTQPEWKDRNPDNSVEMINDQLESIDESNLAKKSVSIEEDRSDSLSMAPLILVVDDNTTNQKITCKFLDKLGYRSLVANDGQQGLEKLASQRQDIALILMDCRMPVMDGLQATQAIRAQGDDIPIVALTANNTEEDREACHAVGMNEFLAKPIQRDKLNAVLKQFLTT